MDPRIQIWNVLHDGEITAMSGEDGATLTMSVTIPYLRARLQPPGETFVLTLEGLTRLEIHNFDGTSTLQARNPKPNLPEILSTLSETMPVRIETTNGYWLIDFQHLRCALDTGQEIEYEIIARACEDYWAAWKARAR